MEITLKALLEAGCHFGHQTSRFHPRMRPFVYGQRQGVYIIDLVKTRQGLLRAMEFVKKLSREKKELLFVGTKRQGRGIIKEAAQHAGCSYASNRWIGGTLTNWEVVRKNLEQMTELEKKLSEEKWTKKEKILMKRRLTKLEQFYGGIRQMKALPAAVFIVDIKKHQGVVAEALRVGVKIVAITDTNSNPSEIDYLIPANDDAVGSIKFIVDKIAEAVIEGRKTR